MRLTDQQLADYMKGFAALAGSVAMEDQEAQEMLALVTEVQERRAAEAVPQSQFQRELLAEADRVFNGAPFTDDQIDRVRALLHAAAARLGDGPRLAELLRAHRKFLTEFNVSGWPQTYQDFARARLKDILRNLDDLYKRHSGTSKKPEQCEGRYVVPTLRSEPFDVTYRCKRPNGHDGPHGDGAAPIPEGSTRGDPDWTKTCENCGLTPVVSGTTLCGPCCTGDASTAGGNW